jgi:hypothetical protein
MGKAHKILVEIPEGKKPLARPKHILYYESIIKMACRILGCGLDSSDSGHNEISNKKNAIAESLI